MPADSASASAVLDGGDDPVVLVGDRPVAVDALWRAVLEPLLRGVDDATLVHPTWWPGARVDTVRAVAGTLAGDVVTRSRATLTAVIAGGGTVVEIAPHLVVVTSAAGEVIAVETRSAAPDIVADAVMRAVLREVGRGPVWLDGPAGVSGVDALAVLIGDRLRAAGRPVHRIDDRLLIRAAAGLLKGAERQDDPPRRGIDPRWIAAVVGSVLTGVVVVGVWGGSRTEGASTTHPTALVEGRVAMEIPDDWAVQRITAGPGSARVQVVSPDDGATALHLTQSQVHDENLAAAAVILRRAIDGQPPGVFVDFDPSDVRAGRPAVTYREIRPGHDIRWSVVLDGSVRISIGCQSAPGTERDITAICDRAVRSAHRLG